MIRTFRRLNVAVRPASSRFAYQICTEQDQDTTSSTAGASYDKSSLTQHKWFSSSNTARDSQTPDSNPSSVIGAVKQRRGEAVKTLSVTGSSQSSAYVLQSSKVTFGWAAASRPDGKSGGSMSLLGFASAYCRHTTRRVWQVLRSTFMPAGYPSTVGPLYLRYSMWSSITNVAVSANSVLASTFMLYAVGLGAGAIPTAGAMNWILKDGIGQLGTLVFGKQIAHNFDVHSKSWFFLSMVQLKLATGVELMTLLFPHHFLFMGSLANAIKGTALMAGASTRSVFNLSFAADNNIADITAKGTSQYILATLLGTAAGATLCTQIGQDLDLAMAAYSVLTTITLYASYATVKSIPLATLNSIRLQLVAEAFLTSITRNPDDSRAAKREEDSVLCSLPDFSGNHTNLESSDRCYVNPHLLYDDVYDDSLVAKVPTPKELAAVDPPLPRLMGDVRLVDPALHVGTDIEVIADNADLLVMLLSTFKYANHMLIAKGRGIHIILREEADARDIVKAYLQESLLTSERLTTIFMAALSAAGWRMERVVVEANRFRATW